MGCISCEKVCECCGNAPATHGVRRHLCKDCYEAYLVKS